MAMEEICFPNNLRKIRTDSGIKMTKVAEGMGLSLSAMSKFEKGYRRMNQKQLLKICKILGCNIEDVFIKDCQTELVNQWQEEISKRVNENENSGLKILGAGLRFIRKREHKIISSIAKSAGLTVSVYHRIEVGSRDLYEDELEKIAKALKRTPETLIKEIYNLYESGKLEKVFNKEEKISQPVLIPGSPINSVNIAGSLYGAKIYELTRKKLVPIYGTPGEKGIIFKKTEEKLAVIPSFLEGKNGIYVVIPVARRLMNILPAKSYLYINPEESVQPGDLAILFDKDYSKISTEEKVNANIVSVREDIDGKIYGVMYNPDEKIKLDLKRSDRLHKIVLIAMD